MLSLDARGRVLDLPGIVESPWEISTLQKSRWGELEARCGKVGEGEFGETVLGM